MYVRNQTVVPEFAWYFRISIGCGTGNRPTKVPCWRNFKISLSSVNPLQQTDWLVFNTRPFGSQFYLSMQIFSTCGTSTCNSLIMVCKGSFVFHEWTHSPVGTHWVGPFSVEAVTRRLLRYSHFVEMKVCEYRSVIVVTYCVYATLKVTVWSIFSRWCRFWFFCVLYRLWDQRLKKKLA